MKHIVICGERHVGKSTLVRGLLAENHRPVSGFLTRMGHAGADGFHPIHIYPAGSVCRIPTEENHVADCDSHRRTVRSEVFETLGVQYLEGIPGGIIVMDELGFMESGSPRFREKVLSDLDGDIPCLCVVKARCDVPFLNAVRSHPRVDLYHVTEQNRSELFGELLRRFREL